MKRMTAGSGWAIIAGTLFFLFIVAFLHVVQPDYDPWRQQMSELALGKFGGLMLAAFFSYALAAFALGYGLRQLQAPLPLSALPVVAACCLLGAGFLRLDNAVNAHIALVSIAFILLVLAMVWVPMKVKRFGNPLPKALCWSLGTGTAAFIAAGQDLVPLGLGQRGATMCLSIWLIWAGSFLIRHGDPHD